MRYYSYEEFKQDIKTLARTLKDRKYDGVVTIARGGFITTHALCEALNIRNIQTVGAISYEKNIKNSGVKLSVKYLELNNLKNILVVDDISDSGETLNALMSYLEQTYLLTTFESATLFYKKTSIYKPTHYVNIANEWIEFFWERDFSI